MKQNIIDSYNKLLNAIVNTLQNNYHIWDHFAKIHDSEI